MTGRNTTFLCGSFFSCSGTRATPKPAEMAWIIVRSRSTSCKTFGIIEASDDVLEDGIVDLELGREIVRRFDAVSLLLKIKQTRVVTLVGFAKELVQPAISVFAIQQTLAIANTLQCVDPRRCAGTRSGRSCAGRER